MKLIDADLLKENILKWLKPSKPDETEMIEVTDALVSTMMEIDEQPTAFDVDKVVEQLDDEANRSYADFKKYADEIGESESDNWYYIGLRRAIGIVKGGGN